MTLDELDRAGKLAQWWNKLDLYKELGTAKLEPNYGDDCLHVTNTHPHLLAFIQTAVAQERERVRAKLAELGVEV